MREHHEDNHGFERYTEYAIVYKKTNIRPELHPANDGENDVTFLPVTPYLLSKSKNTIFPKTIAS